MNENLWSVYCLKIGKKENQKKEKKCYLIFMTVKWIIIRMPLPANVLYANMHRHISIVHTQTPCIPIYE